VSLFEDYGLSTPEDDAPMRDVVAVTAHPDQGVSDKGFRCCFRQATSQSERLCAAARATR
jgi:hypothetical protein